MKYIYFLLETNVSIKKDRPDRIWSSANPSILYYKNSDYYECYYFIEKANIPKWQEWTDAYQSIESIYNLRYI